MSWECRYRSGDQCVKLDVTCDPGRTGCVLRGKVFFPFAPEKNTREMNEAASGRDRAGKPSARSRDESDHSQ